MRSVINDLVKEKSTGIMLLVSSILVGLTALIPAVFVVIVLNKYLTSGVTGTLISLGFGAVVGVFFELILRENRSSILVKLNESIYDPLLKKFVERAKETKDWPAGQFGIMKKSAEFVSGFKQGSAQSWILDWPVACLLLIVLFLMSWSASVITVIFVGIIWLLGQHQKQLKLKSDTVSHLHIFLTGLMTILIVSVGAYMIMHGTLDVGKLIGANILAGRILQSSIKYNKAKELINFRDQAVANLVQFTESK